VIISRMKPVSELLDYVAGEEKIFLIGCGICATYCASGGKRELMFVKKVLEDAGKTVTGMLVVEGVCVVGRTKKHLEYYPEAYNSDSIMVFSCGTGISVVADLVPVKVHPGTDTLFSGAIVAPGVFEEKCSMCGKCELEWSQGVCPHTICPKGIFNGPCGGVHDGKCEVNSERDCAWAVMYERAKRNGCLDELERPREFKDWRDNIKPRRIVVRSGKIVHH